MTEILRAVVVMRHRQLLARIAPTLGNRHAAEQAEVSLDYLMAGLEAAWARGPARATGRMAPWRRADSG